MPLGRDDGGSGALGGIQLSSLASAAPGGGGAEGDARSPTAAEY